MCHPYRIHQTLQKKVSIQSLDKKAALSLLLAKAGIDERLLLEASVRAHQQHLQQQHSSSLSSSSPTLKTEYDLANEVVNITGCLPLTISIAGGLIESNGGEITAELVGMMQEDKFRSIDSSTSSSSTSTSTSLEDRLITASLSSMFKDDIKYLASTCFLSFAAFPEDCAVPSLLFDQLAAFFLSKANDDASSLHLTGDESKRMSRSGGGGGGGGGGETTSATANGFMMSGRSAMLHVRKVMTSLVKVNLVFGSYAISEFTVHDVRQRERGTCLYAQYLYMCIDIAMFPFSAYVTFSFDFFLRFIFCFH
jgi:hypothetical protein